MCDTCADVLTLFLKYENDTKFGELRSLRKQEVAIVHAYVNAWAQRQCNCCYKEPQSFDRFNATLQGLILTVLKICSSLCGEDKLENGEKKAKIEKLQKEEKVDSSDAELNVDKVDDKVSFDTAEASGDLEDDEWTLEEKDRLLLFASKIFLLNFPLYMAFKHSVHCKLEEVTQDEISALGSYCDVNDLEMPIYLLRNVCFFCQRNGLKIFKSCFDAVPPDRSLPLILAHGITAIVSNVKLWISGGAQVQHLVPLRSSIVRFLCRVPELDLRVATNRNMFEYMWTTVKDPLDAQNSLDREGLDLAFKYFTSTTLTMRLAGIAQINSHINLYSDLSHSENLVDATDTGVSYSGPHNSLANLNSPSGVSASTTSHLASLGNALANWLIDNRLVEYIFGPNLHVEIIKQSQVILNYLAFEGRLTNSHIEFIWQAANLKHCSKQVLDLLPPLIKNLDVGPVLYLYRLLQAVEPKDHNEHTLLLSSALIKFLWTNNCSMGQHIIPSSSLMHSSHLGPSVTDHLALGLENIPSSNPFAMINKQAYNRVRLSKGDDEELEDEEEDDEEYEGAGSCSSSPACGAAIISRRKESCHHDDSGKLRSKRAESSSVESSSRSSTSGGSSSTTSSLAFERMRKKWKKRATKHGVPGIKPLVAGVKDNLDLKGESDSHLLASNQETTPDKLNTSKEDQSVSKVESTKEEIDHLDEIDKKNLKRRRETGHGFIKAKQNIEGISPEKLILVPPIWASSADDEGEDEDGDSESSNHPQFASKTRTGKNNQEKIIIVKDPKIQLETRFHNASSDESAPEASDSHRESGMPFRRHHRPPSCYRSRSSKRARLSRFKGIKLAMNEDVLDVEGVDEDDNVLLLPSSISKNSSDLVISPKIQDESKDEDPDMEPLPPLVKAILSKEDIGIVGTKIGSARFKDVSADCLTHLHSGIEASSDMGDAGEEDEDEEDEDEEEEDEEEDCENSCNSSQLSNKSEKNMADFEGELESGCDDELVQLAAAAAANMDPSSHHRIHHHLLHHRGAHRTRHHHSSGGSSSGNEHPSASVGRTHSRLSSLNTMGNKSSKSKISANQPDSNFFQIDSICNPGQTLLWDLVQDDKISQLGEGLAQEAEKILCNLVCWSNVRMIRMKFIEGCLKNLEMNRSVLVSLRLLPRLFASFQQFRSNDCHSVTMWAEKEHHMMQHFFGNLVAYVSSRNDGTPLQPFYNHTEEIQVRLHFLSRIFSSSGSPEMFRLSREQIDVLWCCLATDPECSDELFSWILNQARSTDHALSIELFKHIFLEKMPQLPPESTSMTALALLQQLSSLVRLAPSSYESMTMEADVIGIRQLWGIALKAHSTDVSMAAIHNLNIYYINVHHGTLEKENEFIQQCMDSLKQASNHISEAEESYLTVIQRALLLLKTHIDTFQKRYAYHLRRWHLSNEGVTSHRSRLVSEKTPTWIRIICQPAGTSEKKTFELQNNDYVADLRAEVTNWFEKRRMSINRSNQSISRDGGEALNSPPKTFYAGSAPEGPIRMISQGQELTSDLDEKTLCEMGFKDMQLVFVSIGMARPSRGRRGNSSGVDMGLEPTSSLEPPPRNRLPILLLLQSEHFEQLFSLMQQLGALKAVNRSGQPIVHTKAQILSRRVWEILMMLPTSPKLLKGLEELGQKDVEGETKLHSVMTDEKTKEAQSEKAAISPTSTSPQGPRTHTGNLMELLNPESPQKLMYALQIIEAWRYPRISASTTADNLVIDEEDEDWSQKFVEHGGLRHLFDIFMSGVLQVRDGGEELWNEWHQDCLASLLKLLYLFGIKGNNHDSSRGSNTSNPSLEDELLDGSICTQGDLSTVSRNKRSKRLRRGSVDKLLVPKLNKTMLSMMNDVESVLKTLMSILYEASVPTDPNQYRTGFWGRGQVVHCAITLLVSWAFCDSRVKDHLFRYPNLDAWLKRLVLDDPEPAVRREVCTGFYRLCLGSTIDGDTGHGFIGPLLGTLMKFLSVAQNMRIPRSEEDQKEPYGPGCKDYFWLVCRLIDSLDPEDENQCFISSSDSEQHSGSDSLTVGNESSLLLDLDNLARYLAKAVVARDYRETRHNTMEDDGLRGLLSLATVVVKRDPAFKFSKEGRDFLLEVFDCLFALPSPKQRYLPKCKSGPVRSAAFDLIVELIKGCYENYQCLHKKLMEQHSPGSHGSPYPWDYWPHEDGRSECGYVGLTNLGATCYLASCMQHLYMMPPARNAVLSAQISVESKHEKTLRELQRMFAYLLESERKAYNPRSFCRVYTMDHQPLNTGEQKDMAEFFTDLISKLEEMTPELKALVKNLFCGMISNNVVSLDCPHISRTLEEFYTLRCQVADMRNLFESLDELTVKDTLEGDNMYTCSQCGKKVRAEKRACINKLPRILCFNTMRYTFNMATMTKEKVNTHFSFPPRLDMAPYLEANLLPESHHPKEQRKVDPNDGETETSSSKTTPSKSYDKNQETMEYELIGVTVHTGTADGGHYYSFIRERHTHPGVDKWLLFNDAEVKPFDPQNIAAECFGGEMTSKTYDSVTDKFLDFSFEKTHSAYMLFYERVASRPESESMISGEASGLYSANHVPDENLYEPHPSTNSCMQTHSNDLSTFELSPELAEWIWQDNMQFLQDRNLFEHTYFDFMWQVCGYVPQTLPKDSGTDEVMLLSAKLGTSFVLETLIHSKEKPTIAQWIELLTKQFNASQAACEWFLNTMSSNDWWLVQILLKCPNQVVRQLFQRLCIHVINQLKPVQAKMIFQRKSNPDFPQADNASLIPEMENSNVIDYHCSCIGRFVTKLLDLVELGYKQHLTEYFCFLLEFAKMGEEESRFLLSINAVSTIVNFYLGQKANDFVEVTSEDEEEEDEDVGVNSHLQSMQQQCSPMGLGSATGSNLGVLPLGIHQHNGAPTVMGPPNSGGSDKYKPASLEKMISLVSILVENSRGERDQRLRLSPNDLAAVASPKNFPFLQQQIKDNINLRQTCYLIISLCRWNENLAHMIVNMMFNSITKQPEASAPFFKALSMLVDFSSSNGTLMGNNVAINPCVSANPTGVVGITSGITSFANLILQRIWETAEYCPQQCLEWLTMQAPRNKTVHTFLLHKSNMEAWVERFLIAHSVQRVRYVAALVLVSLVPSNHFRQAFRSARSLLMPQKDAPHMSSEATMIMHQIFETLLNLLKRAKLYVDAAVHGTTKLMSYFALMTYCLVSKTEKLMLGKYFMDLWSLFQPKLSEPAIPVHHNKQALLIFWYQACVDCPENVKLIVQNPHITKNIAFNYILADHDDQEVIVFNRCMLPAYYGLLRLCCQQSPTFTRQLANHQNIQWAFKNITPYTTQYTAAISELFKLMRLFVAKYPDITTEQDVREIHHFKCTTIQLYLTVLDARSCWATLVNALKILMETTDDRFFAIIHGALVALCQAFHSLHLMFHEATACHVTGDLVELLAVVLDLLKHARACRGSVEVNQWLNGWKDRAETVHKLLTLLNGYTPPEVRQVCIEVLQELAIIYPENTLALVVPLVASCHSAFQENNTQFHPGPFFPHQGQSLKMASSKSSLRPQRPILQMFLHPTQVQLPKGVDKHYDQALMEFFLPYHQFVDTLCRLAVSHNLITPDIVNLSAMLAIEGVPLHLNIFPKLWLDIYHSQVGHEFLEILYGTLNATPNNPNTYLSDYMESVLMDERNSLNDPIIYQLFSILLPKVSNQVINEQAMQLALSLVTSMATSLDHVYIQSLIQNQMGASQQGSQLAMGLIGPQHRRMTKNSVDDLELQTRKLIGDLQALTLIFSVEKPPSLPPQFKKVILAMIDLGTAVTSSSVVKSNPVGSSSNVDVGDTSKASQPSSEKSISPKKEESKTTVEEAKTEEKDPPSKNSPSEQTTQVWPRPGDSASSVSQVEASTSKERWSDWKQDVTKGTTSGVTIVEIEDSVAIDNNKQLKNNPGCSSSASGSSNVGASSVSDSSESSCDAVHWAQLLSKSASTLWNIISTISSGNESPMR